MPTNRDLLEHAVAWLLRRHYDRASYRTIDQERFRLSMAAWEVLFDLYLPFDFRRQTSAILDCRLSQRVVCLGREGGVNGLRCVVPAHPCVRTVDFLVG